MATRQRSGNAEGLDPLIGAFARSLGSDEGFWSPELYEIFGLPDTFPASLETLAALMHPDDRRWLLDLDSGWEGIERERGGGTFRRTFRVIRPDGRLRLMDTYGWIRPGRQGGPPWTLGFCRDITDITAGERAYRHLLEQRSMLLQTAAAPTCGVDVLGRIIFANDELAELIGRETAELEGQVLHDLIHSSESHQRDACPFLPPLVGSAGLDPALRTSGGAIERVPYTSAIAGGPPPTAAVIRFLPVDGSSTVNQLRHAQRQEQRVRAERDQIAAALARAEEDERLRIAGDLHDDTVQTLSSVVLDLEGAMAELAGPALEALGFAREQVAGAKLRLRQLMFELLPPDEDDTLRGAVEAYCHGLFAATEIRYELLGDPHPLPHEVNIATYRLVQEALRNVVRHSQGSRVRIELQCAGGMLVARVSDDGIGLHGDFAVSIGHAGLGILRQRARAAGGVAILGQGLDTRGASVELRIPLDHEPTRWLP